MIQLRSRSWALVILALLLPACGVGGGGTLSPTVAPGIPAGVSAQSGHGSVTIAWTPSPAAASYVVQRSINPGGPYATVPGGSGIAGTTFRDAGLTNGEVFYYVVLAGNAFGQSQPSAEVEGVPGIRARKIACGNEHSLALLADGSLWSWGRNDWGQLGIGSTSPLSSIAVEVPLTDVIDIAAGGYFSLALRSDGSLWSWGNNFYGQLGDGTTDPRPVPAPVPTAPPGIVSIAGGEGTVLAATATGEVWGWGSNAKGLLGQPLAVTTVPDPTPIAGLSNVLSVSVGLEHSLAVRSDGSVWACGSNTFGTLGDGSMTDRATFAPVVNLPPCLAVAAGSYHSVALGADGLVWAWGDGPGTSANGSYFPVQMSGVNAIRSIRAGQGFTVAVRSDGTVWSTGVNSVGQLGVPGVLATNPPLQVSLLADVEAIAVGAAHTLAIQDGGLLWGWGQNMSGQLGNGTAGIQPDAKPALGLSQVVDVQVGKFWGAARRSDQTLWTWGQRFFGALGDGGTQGMTGHRVQVSSAGGMATPVAVARPTSSGLALNSNGIAYSWGGNFAVVAMNPIPQPIAGLTGVTGVGSAGSAAGAAFLLKGGAVWGFGQNDNGMVGVGSGSAQINSLTPLPSLSGVVAVTGGDNWAMALTSGGAVWSWGANSAGQLGTTGSSRTSPALIPTLSGVTAIAAGDLFGLALLSDGTVWGWGNNTYGQLGGTTGSGVLPRAVPGLASVTSIAAGEEHSLAIQGGMVVSWGNNQEGQLGNGQINFAPHPVPTPVPGVPPASKVSAGGRSSFALLPDGTLWSWGDNGDAQLANGSGGWTAMPVHITR